LCSPATTRLELSDPTRADRRRVTEADLTAPRCRGRPSVKLMSPAHCILTLCCEMALGSETECQSE
jgi:hypothetical protein